MKILLFIPEINLGFSKDAIEMIATRCDLLYVISPKVTQSYSIGNIHYLKEPHSEPGLKLKYVFQIMPVVVKDLFRKCNFNYLKKLPSRAGQLHSIWKRAERIKDHFESELSDLVIVSFWFSFEAVLAGRLASISPSASAFSFAHGRDLYEWREPNTGILPFRTYQMENLNGIFSISNKGAAYLKKRSPRFAHKFHCSYLGSASHGLNLFKDELFTIVTCAKIRNIKRISHMFDVLKKLDFPVKWIHLGGSAPADKDPDSLRFQKQYELFVNSSSIHTIQNLGNLKKEELIKAYTGSSINLFISLSETEGLPVSMMEAISYGIPILSTDVGGCSEIVTEKTGVLVSPELDYDEIAKKITLFKNSEMNTETFRKGVRRFWELNFNIDKNYNRLIEKIGIMKKK